MHRLTGISLKTRAVVVMGGLPTSTLLTLFVVPVVCELIGGWQERRATRKTITSDDPGSTEGEAAMVGPAR